MPSDAVSSALEDTKRRTGNFLFPILRFLPVIGLAVLRLAWNRVRASKVCDLQCIATSATHVENTQMNILKSLNQVFTFDQ